MKLRVLVLFVSSLGAGLTASAETLHLKNGQTVYGTFNGRAPQGIQFTGTDGRTLIYPYQEVENLNFGPIPAPPQTAPSERISVPPIGSLSAQTDPFLGTWKLNVKKSKFVPGPPRKSETRIVVAGPSGMRVSVDRVNGDGSTQQFEYTTNLDGKSYPITGQAPYGADSISANLTAPNTIQSTLTKNGKTVATAIRTVERFSRSRQKERMRRESISPTWASMTSSR